MSLETRSSSALFKRAEQLKRWEESDTNREPVSPKQKSRKIKFSSGADINTANVDGLTALHQACIDDNLDMVEFLVEHGADVNRGDNEGWTPLHATASCGFLYIAKYLIEKGANVAAVNNDDELSIDIAESQKMEDLLKMEIEKRGIDCKAARTEEERNMLKDAKEWLATKSPLVNVRHPKNGATPLHVASAKGYTDIIKILLQCGADIDAQDVDGWTPIHAASHWGQREACQLLVENLADLNAKNFVGQTAFDVSDTDMLTYLEDLKKKQNEEDVRIRRQAIKRTEIDDRTLEAETPSKVKKLEVEIAPEKEVKANELVEQRNMDNAIHDNISSLSKDPVSVVKLHPPISPKRNVDIIEDGPPWRKLFSKQNESDLGSPIKSPSTEPLDLIGDVPVRKTNNLQNSEKNIGEDKNEINNTAVSGTTNTTVSPNKTSPVTSPQPNTQQPLRRSFVPPVRDEESETQRKAHAKRVRETRRSTQGVTLEEIKSAEQFVKKKNQPNNNNNETPKLEDATKPSQPPSTPSYIRRTSATNNPTQTPVAASTETADVTVTLPLRRPKSVEEKEQDKENDIRNAQATLATQAAIQRRRRPKRRSTGVVSFDNVDDLEQEKELSAGGGDSVSSTKLNQQEGGTERNSRSRISSTSDNRNENEEIDYKKLYEQQLAENDRLKKKLRKSDEELRETRQTLERINVVTSKNSLSELEKKREEGDGT
ncbi:hypothetical protein NQ314_017951 [Rhamnusium bicolor]|uniref:cGMP-dependent protein kinase interacting domain-containing protein n=1 Tax=Rhamnusium bicolor TaxID=1586634 RepID=A0AAV8WSY0_9CUCU|nr:hypothetical protein NQ314_017951 [Rhamnusium bicolor]